MRVATLDFFLTYIEGSPAAIVRPKVRMPRFIAGNTFLLQLLEGNPESMLEALLTRALVRAEKRTNYDG